MAILQEKERDGLRIGSLQNVYQESVLHENYVADMIRSYGTDIRYFKLKTSIPDLFQPILDSRNLSIHAYGEEYAPEFYPSVNMIAYLKFDQDQIILNSFGIQPDSNMTMWVSQTEFALAFAKALGEWKEYPVVGKSEFILDFDSDQDLIENKDRISMEFQTDLFNGLLKAELTDHTLNDLLIHDSEKKLEKPIVIPCTVLEHGKLKIDSGRINKWLYKGDHYTQIEDELVDCHLHLEVVAILKDKTGKIRILGQICGGVMFGDTTEVGKYLDKIVPNVGDLMDIPVPNGNQPQVYRTKYEVVQVQECGANESYSNPFLRNYIYEINLRAYVASGQEEPEGDSKATQELKDKLGLINDAAEDAAKKLSLYEDDWEKNVYGGTEKINKRGNPSVQRDENKSTINSFEKRNDGENQDTTKKAKRRKTTTNLFIFKDMEMVLSLISDPKDDYSFLKLSPAKKTTTVKDGVKYIDYLRCDKDTLVLVNDLQAYMLANRFKQMEIDDQTYCIKPIRLKHQVYAQTNGWSDQPFHLVDADDENQWNMDLQDLIGKNTTQDYKSASENRMTFPWSKTYLYVSYDKVDEDVDNPFEIWTCNVVLEGDETKTPFPICSFINRKK